MRILFSTRTFNWTDPLCITGTRKLQHFKNSVTIFSRFSKRFRDLFSWIFNSVFTLFSASLILVKNHHLTREPNPANSFLLPKISSRLFPIPFVQCPGSFKIVRWDNSEFSLIYLLIFPSLSAITNFNLWSNWWYFKNSSVFWNPNNSIEAEVVLWFPFLNKLNRDY